MVKAKAGQAQPGELIEGVQAVFGCDDQIGQPIEFFAATLTGQPRRSREDEAMELVGIDQRQTRQHACINSVAFGVALVIAAQVGHLLAVDQVRGHLLAGVIGGDREPSHASRLHDQPDCWGGRALACALQQPLQLARSRMHA